MIIQHIEDNRGEIQEEAYVQWIIVCELKMTCHSNLSNNFLNNFK